MTHDKIVIMDGEIHRTEKTYINDIEYIRKDALLEFLKKKVNEIGIAMETGADDPVLWGRRNAFKQVIDIINSM